MAQPPTLIMYGINNCDTIKKARQWLETREIPYHFHDVKKAGLDQATVDSWLEKLDWETLINRRGTTWRQLPETERAAMDTHRAKDAILANPSLFKRPLLQLDHELHVGFKPDQYQAIFGK